MSTPPPPISPSPSPRLAAFLRRAEEGYPLLSLHRAESAFAALKSTSPSSVPSPPFVRTTPAPVRPAPACPDPAPPHFDVLVAGGTLGIFYATALQARGWRVAVVERGPLAGRTQEWNISRPELTALVVNGVLSHAQLADAIVTQVTKPGRIGFVTADGERKELAASGVLNLGVAPDTLVAIAKDNFERIGGVVMEFCKVSTVEVGADAVRIVVGRREAPPVSGALGAGGTGLVGTGEEAEEIIVSARVLVDAMGAFSPIAAQARGFRKPDGVCITVGSCMKGEWPQNETADLIYSFQPIDKRRSVQYFWEAFPVGREDDARTTYMFAYGKCDERRQSLTEALEDYVQALPEYQGVDVDDMSVKRVLFGFFPSYFRDCPTDIKFDRVLPVGDAGGLQSPISFGGFGCCLRHIGRITGALDEALRLENDTLLMKGKLQTLQWYLPSLSVSGLFNKAMSVQPGQTTAGPWLDEFGINEVLWSNMKAMSDLGEEVQRPFLQDIITADGLTKTLAAMAVRNPLLAVKMIPFLGFAELIGWSRHYIALLGYAAALPILKFLRETLHGTETISGTQLFLLNRIVDAATFGSGNDAEGQP